MSNWNRDNNLGRLPPQEIGLEEAVLGAVIMEGGVYPAVSETLNEDDFYTEQHKAIWKAIRQLAMTNSPIDMKTVVSQLKKLGLLEMVGGMFAIAALTSSISSSANVKAHASIVKEMALRREVIKLGSKLHDYAYDDTIDIFETIGVIQRDAISLTSNSAKKKILSQLELYTSTLLQMQNKKAFAGITGIPTGFKQLNRITSGWQNSDLIIIAARPGMGKTSFFLSAVLAGDKPVGIFSLEMAAMQLEERLMSITYEINNERIKHGYLEDHQWAKLANDPQHLSQKPIFIDDSGSLSITELWTRARRMKVEHNIEMLVIDYMQLMTGDKNSKGNREQEISAISRGLKQIAKELNIPVLALSQLSRSVETRGGDKRPQLSDLRESGSIEQDADMVMFLYRPEYYKITVDENGMPTKDMAEVIIAKHRGGDTGTIEIKFYGPFTKFLDAEPRTKEVSLEGVDYTPNFVPLEEAKRRQSEQKTIF
jgi:replicative DNA helicase